MAILHTAAGVFYSINTLIPPKGFQSWKRAVLMKAIIQIVFYLLVS